MPASCGNPFRNGSSAGDALLATSFDYLEPDPTSTWRTVTLDRDEHLSFSFCPGDHIFCPGYDIATAARSTTTTADVGCQ